ncbi:hypothetical protein BO82DRAFT_413271 [Aspergillus uvarum CBS 121591]|uniref:GPI anchored protein n=1 Tax=Aspergillus uvarum CBS 121591 TaxID=1448315 RepID=A0A319CH84_9EURO|nr:hypothetical protein BO82DRAFT_413271 [Aspergillus uvarum CBS 121591]PYH82637.1 hypothetical protein BO82DRAFT_413271 [Aspergillus uvarum CBS 121591]
MILRAILVVLRAGLLAAQATVTDMFIGMDEAQTEGLVASIMGGNADETTYSITCLPPEATSPKMSSCRFDAGLTVIAQPSTTQIVTSMTDTADYEEYVPVFIPLTTSNLKRKSVILSSQLKPGGTLHNSTLGTLLCAFDNMPRATCTVINRVQINLPASELSAANSRSIDIGPAEQAMQYTFVTQDVPRVPVTITADPLTPTAIATTDEVFTLFSSSGPTATVTVSHAAGTSGLSAKNRPSVGVTSGTSSVTLTSTANGTEHASSTNSVTSSKSQGAGPLIAGEARVVAGVAAVALAAAVVL